MTLAIVLFVAAAQPQAVDVHMPGDLAGAPVQTATICRTASGAWDDVVWGPPGEHARALVRPGRCRVLIKPPASTAYLASAEWTTPPRAVHVLPVWLRTIDLPYAAGAVTWQGEGDYPVECEPQGLRVRCLFAPADTGGVVRADDGEVLFAIVLPSRRAVRLEWTRAARGRLVRVRAPAGAVAGARAVRLVRRVRAGPSKLFEAEPVAGVTIHRAGNGVFWLAVTGELAEVRENAWLEIRAADAATTRVPLHTLLSSSGMPVDLALLPGEAIEGDVRAAGRHIEGATVIVSRLIDDGQSKEPGLERLADITTDAAGRFRVDGLSRDRYQVLVMHPSHGRAEAIVTPTAFPRLTMRPRASVSGRVMANGIPVAGAMVQVLPALDAAAGARNPLLFAPALTLTRADGRFEVSAQEAGRAALAVSSDHGSMRIDLGDAEMLGDRVDLGDIRLEVPAVVEIDAELPSGCVLRAAGPLGTTGLRLVALVATGSTRWEFRPPVHGTWMFVAVCGKAELAVHPATIEVPQPRREPVRLVLRR